MQLYPASSEDHRFLILVLAAIQRHSWVFSILYSPYTPAGVFDMCLPLTPQQRPFSHVLASPASSLPASVRVCVHACIHTQMCTKRDSATCLGRGAYPHIWPRRHLRGTYQEGSQLSYIYQARGLLDLCLGHCFLFLILFHFHWYHLSCLGHQQLSLVSTFHWVNLN